METGKAHVQTITVKLPLTKEHRSRHEDTAEKVFKLFEQLADRHHLTSYHI
ncbi:MAG: hypothetical protein LBQ77_01285 [Treponema sp.]|nr:hypothetical protein [Treponema sp.]